MQLSSGSQRVGWGVAALLLAGIGFLPLFGGPSYEFALATGVVLGFVAVVVNAVDGALRPASPDTAFERGIASGGCFALAAVGVAWLHGLRAGFCDFWGQWGFFVLGPLPGALLAGVWGALGVALLPSRWSTRRRLVLGVLLAVAAPLGSVAVSVARYYTSPIIFAFDHFVGYFSGILYDTVLDGTQRLLSYRAGTLGWLAVAYALSSLLRREDHGALVFRGQANAKALVIGGLGLVLGFGITLSGTRLGHYQTEASIRETLGRVTYSKRCEIVYSRGLAERDAQALARECDGHVEQLARYFEVDTPQRVRVFLFASNAQKAWLMGARDVEIAKPWRREIYLQASGYPHPVLGHELAHVLAGQFARGPFGVAGPWGGWVPDPGRIEGVAVAAAPRENDDLSSLEWTRAMQELGFLPSLESLFRLGFLGQNSSKAYTVAGAFLDWLREKRGMGAVKAWYGGASLEAATGESLAQLEQSFLLDLEAFTISPRAMQVARARFDRPAVFARSCPHEVDALLGTAAAALGQLDPAFARETYERVLELDPSHFGARLGRGHCEFRAGEPAQARAIYAELARDERLSTLERAWVEERLGDLAFRGGRAEAANQHYDTARELIVDQDALRTLEVKRAALGAGEHAELARAAVSALLIGEPLLGPDFAYAAVALGRWAHVDKDSGLADYLLGRNLFSRGHWERAAELLDEGLGKRGLSSDPSPTPLVRSEALRTRLYLAGALQQQDVLERTLVLYLATHETSAARKRAARRFAERAGVVLDAVTGNAPADLNRSASPAGVPTPPSTTCPDGMQFVPGGEFWMGSLEDPGPPDEYPRFRPRLGAFCLDRTEVTTEDYARCVEQGACALSPRGPVTCNQGRPGRERHPMNCVSWQQAESYCRFRNARLPTEIEWEYAARGGSEGLRYSWGNHPPDDANVCWKRAGTCAVASFPAGAFGLFDLIGNVWEWTASGYGAYPWPALESPHRIYRGGGWSRRFEKWLSPTLRNRWGLTQWGSHLGFRCAVLPEGGPTCPEGLGSAPGTCRAVILEVECAEGQTWNGARCAAPDAPRCPSNTTFVDGHGCRSTVPVKRAAPGDAIDETSDVVFARSPKFDADCAATQPSRPNAYRFTGGTHRGRTQVGASRGCKNRDVGVGWNSSCCP